MAAVISPMPASKNRSYDIFKNIVPNPADPNLNTLPIQQILANLSVSDTAHDIDTRDGGIPGIKNHLQDNTIQKKMYNEGIPLAYTGNIKSEDQTFSDVIDKTTFQWLEHGQEDDTSFKAVDYVPLTIMKYIKEGRLPTEHGQGSLPSKAAKNNGQKHSFETKNNNKYNVTYFDVKPAGILINAKTFLNQMGYDDGMISGEKNIAFVVDCTSIKFEDILNNGDNVITNNNFKTYLIKSPEGENDPGGKTCLQEKTFQTYKDDGGGKKGVRYRAAVPFEIDKTRRYNYIIRDDDIFTRRNTPPFRKISTNRTFL